MFHKSALNLLPIVLSLFDEPLAEEGLGHALKGFVLALEEVDFVIQTAQHLGDGICCSREVKFGTGIW